MQFIIIDTIKFRGYEHYKHQQMKLIEEYQVIYLHITNSMTLNFGVW